MPSRKDQLQSYQFMMQRVISSIMVRETDPEQTPLRRGVGAVFAGVMLAALVAVGFGVSGVLTGSIGDRWKNEGAIVTERESGAQFVYRDGILQPVLNYASARLVSGSGDPGPHEVSGRDLADIPRAVPVGIPGAPDSLPDRRVGAPWTMCSMPERDPAGTLVTVTALLLGGATSGGAPLAEKVLLVRDAEDGTRYLVWHSHRYRIADAEPEQVIRSLYGFQAEVVPAGSAWLNGLPSGQDIGPLEVGGIDRWGEPSSAVSGYTVGQVVQHSIARGEQYFLVRDDGLAHLTQLQRLLLRGEHGSSETIPAAQAGAAATSDALAPAGGETAPPAAPPELAALPAGDPPALCAVTTDSRSRPQLVLGGELPPAGAAPLPTGGESATGARLVDLMMVPPGRIAVVRVLASETAPVGSYQLITDVGVRYPVPSEEVLGMLGYAAGDAVEMPAALLQRIPEGPTLDPAAAMRPAPGY